MVNYKGKAEEGRLYSGVERHPNPGSFPRMHPLHRTDSVLRRIVSIAYDGLEGYAERMERDVPARVANPDVLAVLEKYKKMAMEEVERERIGEESRRKRIVIPIKKDMPLESQ